MFCPRHSKQRMTPTGRRGGSGVPIYQCPLCVAAIRAKLAMVLEIGRRCRGNNKPARQVVLPPVPAWER